MANGDDEVLFMPSFLLLPAPFSCTLNTTCVHTLALFLQDISVGFHRTGFLLHGLFVWPDVKQTPPLL